MNKHKMHNQKIYAIKTIFILTILRMSVCTTYGQWPMSNDLNFNHKVAKPAYKEGSGPRILLDGAHNNFFIQTDFIKPFSDLAKADGYQTIVDSLTFESDYLQGFEIVVIITALPFDFTSKNEGANEQAFSEEEINTLFDWVNKGGSLLVFSEHAPFDQAINELLQRFGIQSSIGTTIDSLNYNKKIGKPGWIEYSIENGGLNKTHPILMGNSEKERIRKLISFGGSALSGKGYYNLLKLSASSQNIQHSTGIGPIGKGNSQALAGAIGRGKIVALGDSNGFTAMNFQEEDGSVLKAGMNIDEYDWKQFVLNTLHWLSGKIE